MSVIVDPKLGINVYAPFQSNQWEDSKKARRWLSFFASRVVMDTSCTALPASPAEGDTVLMSSSYPIHASEIARYSTELMAWEYLAPWAGLTVCDTSGNEWYFSGSAWVQNPVAGISAMAATVSTHTAQIAALQAGGGSVSGLPPWYGELVPTPPDAAAQTALGSDSNVVFTNKTGRTVMTMNGSQAVGWYGRTVTWSTGTAILGLQVADGIGSFEAGLIILGSTGKQIKLDGLKETEIPNLERLKNLLIIMVLKRKKQFNF